MGLQVTAFTDTYLPTVNGVSYTLQTWRERFEAAHGRMQVVYPGADGYDPAEGEHPVESVPFPFYDGFRLGAPWVPTVAGETDLVHAHTPFSLGLAGLALARRRDLPFVASYHTPAGEYADYLAPFESVAGAVRGAAETYERLYLDRADVVVVPSRATRRHLRSQVGVGGPVVVVPNGVDLDRFRPVEDPEFRERHDLPAGPLVGYTGRHGYEKRLPDLIAAAPRIDATVVVAGDGPARADLERRADEVDADVRFLGFLDREELPAFYSTLDVFAFPSPVETQGLVALEATACGTPVVGVDEGALADTVEDGRTGYTAPAGDPVALAAEVNRALGERDRLRAACLAGRDRTSVDRSVDDLVEIYRDVV